MGHIAAAVLLLASAMVADAAPPADPVWDAFVAGRSAHLQRLAEPILACVEREDSEHRVFHGCLDWHSAVHATWALHVLTRVTGDPQYLRAANAVLDPDDLIVALDDITQGVPGESGYGYTWFLVLAMERQRAGYTDLTAHAEVVARSLETGLATLEPAQLDHGLVVADYGNLSWQVHNLWAYAVTQEDTAAQARLVAFVRSQILPRAASCTPSVDRRQVDDFLPACLQMTRTLLDMLPGEVVLPAERFHLPVIADARGYAAGLNFSRSWGLWSLWESTGERRYRNLYVEHIETQMATLERWAEDYAVHAHWVAQFGVYGIELSYGSSRGR